MTARFITAPDKLPVDDPEERHTKILIVDSEWDDIQNLGFLSMTRQIKYDFYLFGPTSIDLKWLEHAIDAADTILVNGAETGRNQAVKTEVSKSEKTVVMGEGNIIKTPMDFIVGQLEEEE